MSTGRNNTDINAQARKKLYIGSDIATTIYHCFVPGNMSLSIQE